MQARMSNPITIVPDALQALQALRKSAEQGAVPSGTIGLVQLHASQINGCSACVDQHCRLLKEAGETDERLFVVAAWRDAPYFTDAERAALALAEAVTRGPGPRLDLGGGRPALRRAGTGSLDPHDRHSQPLQPPPCHHQAGGRQPELVAPDPRCAGAGGEPYPRSPLSRADTCVVHPLRTIQQLTREKTCSGAAPDNPQKGA